MAHEVKLNVYTLRIKRHAKQELVNFDSFYNSKDDPFDTEPDSSFVDFFKSYVESFDGKFWVQEMSGKALHLANNNLKFASKKRIIYGTIDGGSTGIGSKIKRRDDVSDELAFQMTSEHVESIPYYFLMWLPEDSDVGLLIVQSLGTRTIADVFKSNLRSFFNKNTKALSLLINEQVPKEAAKTFKEYGKVDTVTLRRYRLPSTKAEKLLGLKYIEGEPINVDIVISGLSKIDRLKDKINEYVSGGGSDLFDTDGLENLGIDGTHQTLVKYEFNGKVAVGSSENSFKLSPSYYVNESYIIRNTHKHPTFESVNDFCQDFILKLQEEIGYTAIK